MEVSVLLFHKSLHSWVGFLFGQGDSALYGGLPLPWAYAHLKHLLFSRLCVSQCGQHSEHVFLAPGELMISVGRPDRSRRSGFHMIQGDLAPGKWFRWCAGRKRRKTFEGCLQMTFRKLQSDACALLKIKDRHPSCGFQWPVWSAHLLPASPVSSFKSPSAHLPLWRSLGHLHPPPALPLFPLPAPSLDCASPSHLLFFLPVSLPLHLAVSSPLPFQTPSHSSDV